MASFLSWTRFLCFKAPESWGLDTVQDLPVPLIAPKNVQGSWVVCPAYAFRFMALQSRSQVEVPVKQAWIIVCFSPPAIT